MPIEPNAVQRGPGSAGFEPACNGGRHLIAGWKFSAKSHRSMRWSPPSYFIGVGSAKMEIQPTICG